MADPINRMEIDPEETKEYAQRAKLLAMAEDALTLLEGWIRRYCKPSFLSEHLEDLAKKRTILEAAKSSPRYVLPPAWIPVGERRPERNASVLYWHRPVEPRGPGWLAQADEWRDEQHLPIATHWMPMPKEPASISSSGASNG